MSKPLSHNIRLLYIHNFLIDFRPQSAFLVVFFQQIAGSYAGAMTVLATETLTSALMDIPTGILSDHVGRRVTIILGSFFTALGVSCYALALSSWILFLGALFMGIGSCLFNGNNTALLYETLKSENKEAEFSHYQGRAGGMFQFALGISALCSSFVSHEGLRFIFILGIIPQVLSIIVSFIFREPKTHIEQKRLTLTTLKNTLVSAYKNKRLRLLMIGQAISYGAGESTFMFKSAFVNALWPTWAVGIYRGLNHALGFVGFWFAGRILKRIQAPYILAIAESYWFITQSIAVLIANVVTPILILSEAGVYGSYMVARDKLMQEEFSDQQRATLGSAASFLGSIVYAIVAYGIGAISDHYSLAAGVGFGVVMSATSLPIFVWLFRKHFNQKQL